MRFLSNLCVTVALVAFIALWIYSSPIMIAAVVVTLALWSSVSRWGRQSAAIAMTGISGLRHRLGAASVVVVGIAGVVGVLVALLAMANGYAATFRKAGNKETAIVLRGASGSEVMSMLNQASVTLVSQAPGVARNAQAKPIVSPEILVAATLRRKGVARRAEGSVLLRGVGEEAWAVRPHLKIIAGRKFEPGLRELDVGEDAEREFAGLGLGRVVTLGAQKWTVVGVFAHGGVMDSEIWGDVNTVADVFGRGSSRDSVWVRLTSAQAYGKFKDALLSDPRLHVDVATSLRYFRDQSASVTKTMEFMGTIVAVIMAIGATFGALNTMFSAVARRKREIATFRAIGFHGVTVVVAVMLETMLLAALGGAIGISSAWTLFDGFTASTLAPGAVGQLSFAFSVTPGLSFEALKWALAIGFVGGLFPAIAAARLSVASALRSV